MFWDKVNFEWNKCTCCRTRGFTGESVCFGKRRFTANGCVCLEFQKERCVIWDSQF